MSDELNTIVFGIPDMPFSSVRVPYGSDYEAVMAEASLVRDAYLAAFGGAGGHIERAAQEQHGATPAPPPRPAQQQAAPSRPTGGSGSPSGVVYVFDEHGEQVPACPQHKTREGGPRPFKFFEANRTYPATWKCTAKKQDGTYCTNAVNV